MFPFSLSSALNSSSKDSGKVLALMRAIFRNLFSTLSWRLFAHNHRTDSGRKLKKKTIRSQYGFINNSRGSLQLEYPLDQILNYSRFKSKRIATKKKCLNLLTQDVIWTSIQRFLNVMDVAKTTLCAYWDLRLGRKKFFFSWNKENCVGIEQIFSW